MVAGTLNGKPTFDKLNHEIFIVDLSEVGLLQDKNEPIIGVSPDGISGSSNTRHE